MTRAWFPDLRKRDHARTRKIWNHQWKSAAIFMFPSISILGVFVIWPIFQTIYFSFYDWTIGAQSQKWLGIANYQRLIQDTQFWNALRITTIITIASTSLLVVLGFSIALALQRNSWVTKILRSVFFFPTIVSLTTIGLVWKFLLDPSFGFIGGITRAFGFQPLSWLESTHLALPTIIFVNVWKNIGFPMIVLLAALKGVPTERYEAARIDGASNWQITRYITVPSLRLSFLFATLILTIQSLQIFDLVYVMTSGGPIFQTDTLMNLLYRNGFVNFETGYASATSVVLFIIIIIVSAFQLKIFRFNDAD